MRPNVPDAVKPYVDRAIDLEREGCYDEAIAVYREALALYPRIAVLHNNLGCCLANQHQYAAAEAAFLRAIALTYSNREARIVTPASYPDEPAHNLSAIRAYRPGVQRRGMDRRVLPYVCGLVTRSLLGRGLALLALLVMSRTAAWPATLPDRRGNMDDRQRESERRQNMPLMDTAYRNRRMRFPEYVFWFVLGSPVGIIVTLVAGVMTGILWMKQSPYYPQVLGLACATILLLAFVAFKTDARLRK